MRSFCQFCRRALPETPSRVRNCCEDGRDYDLYLHRDDPPTQGELLSLEAAVTLPPAALTVSQLSDDVLREFWARRGGEFHGPNIETGTMPESLLLPLLRELIAKGPV